MRRLSRRGFIVLGGTGTAGLALASCGEEADPRDEGRDEELLSAALSAELALQSAYGGGGLSAIAPTKPTTDLQDERIARLGDLGAEDTETPDNGDVIDASNAAIAAYRELAGLGSTTEARSAAVQGLAEIAAVLAAVRVEAGDAPVPSAFVTGGADAPYEPAVADDSAADATATAEETETTTATEEGG